MKPREFDDLVRQKFDQNDLRYSPKNWARLEEQLDGRSKKRSIIMWWLMPVAGIAASVALAVGVAPLMRFQTPADQGTMAQVRTRTSAPANNYNSSDHAQPVDDVTMPGDNATTPELNAAQPAQPATPTRFGIDLQSALATNNINNNKSNSFDLAAANTDHKKDLKMDAAPGYNTFRPEEEPKAAPRLSVMLSAGVAHGSQNSGYTAGATIRRMINDKVYIESDVAFTTSSATQANQYMFISNTPVAVSASGAGGHAAAARTTSVTSTTPPTVVTQQTATIQTSNDNYSMYYAQITPSIGCKIIKKLSIAAGPDFQQLLADNKPAVATGDRSNLQVASAASFDVGLVGKTEYSVTRNIRAGVSYRKGMNNFINPTLDKYIDRDYLQFQIKCAIFNR
jgi:hypothetical protein